MDEKKDWEFLNILTKSEIIGYLKQEQWFRAPTQEKVNFYKWDTTARKLQKEMGEYLKDDSSTVLAKEHDRLAKIFNESKDSDERFSLIKKISVIDKKLKAHHEKWNVITAKQKKNDKLLK